MVNSFEDRQAKIDDLLQNTKTDPIPVEKRLLGLAKLGRDTPKLLTPDEISRSATPWLFIIPRRA